MVPQDYVQALSSGDVVGAVALSPQMNHTVTLQVLEGVGVLAVVGSAHDAAELEASSFEVKPKADIEGHIRVICVHVKPQILALPIAHDEAVVPVPASAWSAAPEKLAQGLQQLLELVNHGLQSDLIQNDAVVVHAVWPPCWQAAAVEVEDLLDKHVEELICEDLEGEHFVWQLLDEDGSPRLRCLLGTGFPKGRIEPLFPPAWRALE
mmetsp:Transcript_62456/g.101140  ORF Transcript_62456/g.101140 Transcript_62456/m.101140 type:complete len:208 (-) Transcript_62456:1084-1707(-)